jgi:hypothetical protein
MFKIEIHSAELKSFKWTDKKQVERTGHKQSAFAHLPDKPFPVEIQLRVDDESKAYPKGMYTLAPNSFWIDRFGSLQVAPVLVPVGAEKAKVA